MDSGPEAITDAAELAQVRRQALNAHIQAVVLALLATVAALLL